MSTKAPKNQSQAPATPGPAYTLEGMNWRTLRDALNDNALDPAPRPSVLNGTPADFIPHITLAHTCGLTSGVSGTPTMPTMI